jgi:hypothetical protein
MDVAFLRLETGRLDAAAVQRLLALDGVEAVYPQAPVQFPISAEGGIGGMTYASDIVVHGAPAGLIARELGDPARFAWNPRSGEPVPVAASAYFLDLYNIGLAESAGLPKLARSAAIGRTFELILGQSSVGLGSAGTPRRVQARIVALVADPNLVGMVAPLDVVEAWNREFAPRKPQTYTRVHVDAASAMEVPALRAAIEAQGFTVTAAGERLDQARSLVSGVEVAALASAARSGACSARRGCGPARWRCS